MRESIHITVITQGLCFLWSVESSVRKLSDAKVAVACLSLFHRGRQQGR